MAWLCPKGLFRKHADALFWIGEAAATCAFVVLVMAIICAPYLLGGLPEVDAEFMQEAR